MPKYTLGEKAKLVGIAAHMLTRGPGENARIGDLEQKWNRIEAKAKAREKGGK